MTNNQHTDEMREALWRLIIERAHWGGADEMVDFIIRECAPILSTRYRDVLREADMAAFEHLAMDMEWSVVRMGGHYYDSEVECAWIAYQAATTRYEAALREASCALTFASGRCTPEVQIAIGKAITTINKLLGEANG